jgi:hypothetical protein
MRDQTYDGNIYGGRPTQSVHEQSGTQKYPLGTLYEAFGKKWRYCKAFNGNITPAHRGCPSSNESPWQAAWTTAGGEGFGSGASTATGYEGEDWFILTLGAKDDVARVVDQLQGGLITLYRPAPRDNEIFQFRIMGNDLPYQTTLANDTMKIYVDPPLLEDYAAVPCDGSQSLYRGIEPPVTMGTSRSVIVVPEIIVTSHYYFWGQTRGPCFVTPGVAGWITVNTRGVRFGANGCVWPIVEADGGYQYAGYLLHDNTTLDDSHIMLMLE